MVTEVDYSPVGNIANTVFENIKTLEKELATNDRLLMKMQKLTSTVIECKLEDTASLETVDGNLSLLAARFNKIEDNFEKRVKHCMKQFMRYENYGDNNDVKTDSNELCSSLERRLKRIILQISEIRALDELSAVVVNSMNSDEKILQENMNRIALVRARFDELVGLKERLKSSEVGPLELSAALLTILKSVPGYKVEDTQKQTTLQQRIMALHKKLNPPGTKPENLQNGEIGVGQLRTPSLKIMDSIMIAKKKGL